MTVGQGKFRRCRRHGPTNKRLRLYGRLTSRAPYECQSLLVFACDQPRSANRMQRPPLGCERVSMA